MEFGFHGVSSWFWIHSSPTQSRCELCATWRSLDEHTLCDSTRTKPPWDWAVATVSNLGLSSCLWLASRLSLHWPVICHLSCMSSAVKLWASSLHPISGIKAVICSCYLWWRQWGRPAGLLLYWRSPQWALLYWRLDAKCHRPSSVYSEVHRLKVIIDCPQPCSSPATYMPPPIGRWSKCSGNDRWRSSSGAVGARSHQELRGRSAPV